VFEEEERAPAETGDLMRREERGVQRRSTSCRNGMEAGGRRASRHWSFDGVGSWFLHASVYGYSNTEIVLLQRFLR